MLIEYIIPDGEGRVKLLKILKQDLKLSTRLINRLKHQSASGSRVSPAVLTSGDRTRCYRLWKRQVEDSSRKTRAGCSLGG